MFRAAARAWNDSKPHTALAILARYGYGEYEGEFMAAMLRHNRERLIREIRATRHRD